MTNDMWAEFGERRSFQIALRWLDDPEPVGARPAGYGWSFGSVKIVVAGVNLTAGHKGGRQFSEANWYLAPFLDWLVRHWVSILHEEDFAWHERSSRPAALACRDALDRFIGTSDARGREAYQACQSWYGRHALRSVASGGLIPDLFLRRFEDLIEVSWTATPPEFAPRGFFFDAAVGSVRLPVMEVAAPLWEALQWAASHPPDFDTSFRQDWTNLSQRIHDVGRTSAADCDRAMLSPDLYEKVWSAFAAVGRGDLVEEHTAPLVPVVDVFSPAVAMYGGVSPQLGSNDVAGLRDQLIAASGGQDAPRLNDLIKSQPDKRPGIAHKEGYAFAEDLLDDLELPVDDFIDIRQVCADLCIRVETLCLETDTIRGVAMAGISFSPTILINMTSLFNRSDAGERFTIAHELCHVLYDRAVAQRITHVSGPWVAPAIERRANAFAAYLLMPRALLAKASLEMDLASFESVRMLAQRLHVNASALTEHLYNLDFVDEVQREGLRVAFSIN